MPFIRLFTAVAAFVLVALAGPNVAPAAGAEMCDPWRSDPYWTMECPELVHQWCYAEAPESVKDTCNVCASTCEPQTPDAGFLFDCYATHEEICS